MADIIDINVQVAVDEVNIIANPNNYVININRIIGEQVQSDWDQIDDQAPDYIKNKPSIPSIDGLATVTYVDTQDALKVDKITGKGLSENDFTNTLKNKLDGIEDGAQVNVNADWNATSGDAEILNKPTIPSIDGLATVIYVDDQDALKVDKVVGYGLSENDFTNTLKTKLDGIESGAQVNVNADWDAISGDAEILNKPTIPDAQVNSDWDATSGVAEILNKPTIPAQVTNTSELINDGSDGINPFITANDIPDTQVNSDWNATSGVAEILNKPTIPSIDGLATVIYVDDQDALKVDKVVGYGLSENDFTNTLKTKLDGIQDGAEVNVNADWNATTGDAQILNKPTIPAAQVNSDWNATSGLAEILNKPAIPTPVTNTSDLINDGEDGVNPFITAQDIPTFASADKITIIGRNSTGSTLYRGTIVYILGSTGNRPNFVKSIANSEGTSAGTFGVIENDIPNNTDGNCVTIGVIDNLDTRSGATHPFTSDTLADGDVIYLSPTTAGYITNVKPSAPNHLVYIGNVIRTSPTLGTIVYRIQNGFELQELHNVAINGVSNNQLLAYESSTSLWKNKSITTAEIADSVNKRYVTDANLTTIANQSGTNTGDETTATIKSKLGITTLSGSNTGDQDLSNLVVKNTAIVGATKTKITYDSKGLVTVGADATTADISDSLNKRYVTDANLVTIANQSGTNTGDETTATIKTKLGITTLSGSNTGDNATNTQYSSLVSNATHSGDATGATILTLATVNSNVGTFGTASNVAQSTVNAKGLTTAISNVPIQITQSQVTSLDTNLGLKANLASPTFTGTVVLPSTTSIGTITNTELSYVDGVTSSIQTQLNGKQATLTNPITGTGTTNYLPKFTGASALGNSSIVDLGTTEAMRISSAGNVGIGQDNPQTKLDVVTSGTVQTTILGRGQDGNFRFNTRQDVSTNTDGSVIGELGLDYITTRNSAIRFHRGVSTTGGFVTFTTNDGSERMRVASNGNVGIGTTSPGFPLSLGTGLGNKIALYDASGGLGYGFGIQASLLQIFTNTGSDDISFGYGNSTAFNRNVTFKGGGNVGIGTTSPTSKLQVVGLIDYATNALAIAGGLTVGAFYHTSGVVKVVI